ncbi:hypothetical protein GGF48_000974 [Coemansia sp. RSA 921]|nr:hypothetical protein GGF48_000974 [Coemansia sp. RSA 921]
MIAKVLVLAASVLATLSIASPVRRGDYCYKIAQVNGISYEKLLWQNPGLSCVNLQVGQSICLIPQSSNWNDWKGSGSWNNDDYDTGARNLDSCKMYSVKEGDLCSHIAAANGLTFSELVELNEDTPNWNGCKRLYAGQKICT